MRQPSSWLVSAGGLILYLWAPAILYAPSLAGTPPVPGWVPIVAPLTFYAALFSCLRHLTAPQRVTGTVALFAVHFLLGLLTGWLYEAGGPLALGVPLEQALWTSRAAPLAQLFGVSLAVWPFRDLLGRRRAAGPAATLSLEDFTLPRPRLTPPLATPTPVRRAPQPGPVGTAPPPDRAVPPPAPASPSLAGLPLLPPPPPARWIFLQPATPEPREAVAPAPPAAVVDAAPAAAGPALEAEPVVEEPSPAVETPAAGGVEPFVAAAVARPDGFGVGLAAPGPPAVIGTAAAGASADTPAPTAVEEPAPIVGAVTPAAPTIDREEAERLCARLLRVGALELDVRALMGITLLTAYPGRLGREAVVRDAFRVLSRLGDSPAVRAVDQVTLRGPGGALVLTPLTRLGDAGPALAVAVTQKGALAMLEILARRLAAEYQAAHPEESRPAVTRASREAAPELAEIDVPAGLAPLARGGAAGAVPPRALRDPASRLSLYLFLDAGADARAAGRMGCELRPLMELPGEPGGIGSIDSVVLRVGERRVVLRSAPVPDRPTVLVSAGPEDGRFGLLRLELDRAVERLAAG
jgi:hypothetical protein